MFDEIKDRLRSALKEEKGLSIVPERKGITLNGEVLEGEYLARNGFAKMALNRLGGVPAWSGEPVSNQTAMGLSTVYACNKIISETKGFLPLNMMRTDGVRNDLATNHPMYDALLNEPNCETTAAGFGELLTSHCLLSGNGFAQIVRRSGNGTAIELYPILPDNVQIDREKTGQKRKVYIVKEANQPDTSYTIERDKAQGILHLPGLGWDGMRGYSVIHMARQSLGTALAQERNVALFYANGGRVPYLLKASANTTANVQEEDAFRDAWEKVVRDPHKVPILTDDLTYQQIGLSAKDAQLLESRLYTVAELCRWFGISPHLVGDLSKATFSNVAALAEQFQKFTMQKWLTLWEQSLRRCVLTPDEKRQGYYFTHDLSALLKADYTARLAGYATMLQNGVYSVNNVLAMEGLNPIPDGDTHRVQVNLAPLGDKGPNGGANAGVIKQ